MKKIVIIIALLLLIALGAFILMFSAGMIGIDTSTPGWKERGDKIICYIDDTGERVTGYQLIDGSPYYFKENGRPADKGWIKDGDETFYCRGSGNLQKGWKYIDNKVYYFYDEEDKDAKAGLMATNWTTPGAIEIPEDGGIGGDEGLALAYGIDVLNRYGWNLKSAYRYSASLRFERGSDKHYGFTTHTTAIYGFENGGGNCLAWSGTFCVMAKLLGYDCRQIWGTLQWKTVVPHAWTEVWAEDGIHVYDPRKHDGEDMAGFDFQYGDEGTYKYDLDSREYLEW